MAINATSKSVAILYLPPAISGGGHKSKTSFILAFSTEIGLARKWLLARLPTSVKERVLSEHGESSSERWFSDDLKPGSREQSEK